jgi:hypothetical protein
MNDATIEHPLMFSGAHQRSPVDDRLRRGTSCPRDIREHRAKRAARCFARPEFQPFALVRLPIDTNDVLQACARDVSPFTRGALAGGTGGSMNER